MDQIHKQIVQLQNKCNDYIDNRSAQTARTLQQAIQKLEDEAQSGKNARSLGDRLDGVIRILEEVGDENAMDQRHARELIEMCEHLRDQLKKLQ